VCVNCVNVTVSVIVSALSTKGTKVHYKCQNTYFQLFYAEGQSKQNYMSE